MNLLDRYLSSTKKTVQDARLIPGQKVNVFDQNNDVQKQFDTFEKPLDPTSFTPKALAEHDRSLDNLTEPANGFERLEQDIPLNRWNYKNEYYSDGQPRS